MSQNAEAQAPVTPNPAMLRLLAGASPENQHAVLTEAGPTIQAIALDSILAADPDMNSPDYYPDKGLKGVGCGKGRDDALRKERNQCGSIGK